MPAPQTIIDLVRLFEQNYDEYTIGPERKFFVEAKKPAVDIRSSCSLACPFRRRRHLSQPAGDGYNWASSRIGQLVNRQ